MAKAVHQLSLYKVAYTGRQLVADGMGHVAMDNAKVKSNEFAKSYAIIFNIIWKDVGQIMLLCLDSIVP